MAEVEILMGTRNGARYLEEQLQSIAAQTVADWTLTVSDDGSSDATHRILERFSRSCAPGQVRVRGGPRQGVAANYLSLLEASDCHAPFVALSDQDDIWHSDRLERGVAALRSRAGPRPVLYAARTVLIDAAGRPIRHRQRALPRPSFGNALVQNVLAGNTMMLNRAAVGLARTARPATLPPFHDWWLYALMTGAGAEIVIDPVPVLGYRQHRNALIGARSGVGAHLTRAALVARGTWAKWLDAHHTALLSVDDKLDPANRARLRAMTEPGRGRLRAVIAASARRQDIGGTLALHLAALARRA
ncbi:glycosyltransferase [Rhodobacterales bacterium HKCCE3408]|nr:glycosyltransferase [Rhodobacterales bacterium HKCCE3408]